MQSVQNQVQNPSWIATNTSSIRVAIFSDAESQRNGVGAYYHDLMQHLEHRNARVEIFDAPLFTRPHRFSLSLPGDKTQKIYFPSFTAVKNHLNRLQPNIIIIATPGPFGFLGWRWARKLNTRHVVGFHTDYEKLTDIYWNPFFGHATRYYFEWANRLIFRNSHRVLANSEHMLDVAKKVGADNVALMGTPIPIAFIEQPIKPISTPPKHILFAGRLAAEKNILEVLEAVSALPNYEFYIAGDGPEKSSVQAHEKTHKNLHYVGWLKRNALLKLFDQVDMLLLPSEVESFGTIALEGMARSRIVLVSGNCGITQWPELNEGLFRIAHGESVTCAIKRTMSLDPALLKLRATHGRDAAVNLNNWSIDTWLNMLGNSEQ